MTQSLNEYKQIREARLALLCVGDIIYYVSTTWRVYPYCIVAIEEDRVRVRVGGGYSPYYMFSTMETYKGEVYVYMGSDAGSYESKIERMIEIVESHVPLTYDS
jgi:hypothetical protein